MIKDTRLLYYGCQVTELVLVVVGILTNSWIEGVIYPTPYIRIDTKLGLMETCMSWLSYTACASDGEVISKMSSILEKDLSFIEAHSFDIPRGFFYIVIGFHFISVVTLIIDHPIWLPRATNMVQCLFLVVSLCWFGLSSFKESVCGVVQQCYFGFSFYIIVTACVLNFLRLLYQFMRPWKLKRRRDSEVPYEVMPQLSSRFTPSSSSRSVEMVVGR